MENLETVTVQLPQKPTLLYSIIGILIVCLLIFAGLTAYYFGKANTLANTPQPTTSPEQVLITKAPIAIFSPTPTPTAALAQTGTVSGKLCYPSSFLPKGTIEAKNTTTAEITTQDYIGSQAGGTNTYSFALKPGSYYLRYSVDPKLQGYHSETCKTGTETSCADSNPRVLIAATVENGKTITNYDLCDFYYSDATKPTF